MLVESLMGGSRLAFVMLDDGACGLDYHESLSLLYVGRVSRCLVAGFAG